MSAEPTPDPLAENRGETAKPPKRGRGPGRPFEKGNNANPGGRPKGLARAAREVIGDELAWLALMADMARDSSQPNRDRIAAWTLATQYGYGKPAEYAPIEDSDPLEIELYRQPDEERAVELAQIVVELEPRRRAKADSNGQ